MCSATRLPHTKPSSILKSQIPIIISSELNLEEPGHYQIDLVGHDGGNPNGHFAFTLNAVELSCGWIEPQILLNKAQRWSKQALQNIFATSPLPILSFHSDNDSAFLNENLQSWCLQRWILCVNSSKLSRNHLSVQYSATGCSGISTPIRMGMAGWPGSS